MSDNVKPQAGVYGTMTNEDFPESIKFDVNIPVVCTFAKDYTEPKELPNKEGDGVYYVFPAVVEGVDRTVMTSAWTLLKKLKDNEPLAGKTFVITKKLLGSKQEFFVEEPTVPKDESMVEKVARVTTEIAQAAADFPTEVASIQG